MAMDLTGIKNQNEYYTNHYFSSIFEDNAGDTISSWRLEAKQNDTTTPWAKFRDTSKQYYRIRDRYLHLRNEEQSKPMIQEMANLYLQALGYGTPNSIIAEVVDEIKVPVFHEETKSNGAPLLWVVLSVASEREDDILQGRIFGKSESEEKHTASLEEVNDNILSKLFFAGEEAPRWIVLIGINQIALIDRNKWNEKRFLQFDLDDIFSRHEETTFQALCVLLHKESLCPTDGTSVLDTLDENSHKHSAGVSDSLKYALRECIELLGNEVIYDMKTRQQIDLDENPVDASELTIECLRYMYRVLFMLFIEARPELGYAPMKSQTYVQGYSLEGLRDVCERVREERDSVSEGYYIDDTISELFRLVYEGYPGDLESYKKAVEMDSLHDVFTIEALKAHIFDPEYTKLITNARLRNVTMLQIIDLMSISRPGSAKERRGRISYSALGINQMGAVYEALLSYRGFLAEETLFEVKRAGDKFNELDVGYFVPESELDNYTEDERVRYEKGEQKGQLRRYEKGTFIYRLAGREREKSASYYTPEVLTKCLVKYALKELLKDKSADEILHLTICEPAMGSAAFLNEAINQLAEAYLNKKQEELHDTIPFDKRFEELQKVKMFIADRNVYGVDLNPIAVELAEVSLWLNTIYKGAYVPWFGTQLVCGNSLIGARRQVYYTSKLETGNWFKEAPDRVMPGEKRKRTGVSSRVYHFLLGDPGMANYSDKVIKGLEPENIKKIENWRKKFTEKWNDSDIQTLLRLSEVIDDLWDRTVKLRQEVEKATSDHICVYGYEEDDTSAHTTIREKDKIYKKMFKSEHMNNAGPYARLKAAMDYWCALWFWPIDKAELLPTRQEFLFDMGLMLEGGIQSVSNTKGIGQMEFFMDNNGNATFGMRGTQLELDIASTYQNLGNVNLDQLRENSERLRIANEIVTHQRFMHWEVEFADLFFENNGFDLILGNPPWLRVGWNEQGVLADMKPEFAVKKLSATQTGKRRNEIINTDFIRNTYIDEYTGISGQQNFLNSIQNYSVLQGMKANLYKCFLPLGWMIGHKSAISAFVHPEGVYDDPQGGALREKIYSRLRKHFMFANERKLFPEVHHHTQFSLNVYGGPREIVSFDTISNLYDVSTIVQCSEASASEPIPKMKDDKGEWNTKGHPKRILHIGKHELLTFSKIFDESIRWSNARLPVLHAQEVLEVLLKLSDQTKHMSDKNEEIFTSQMWNETNSQNDGTIKHVEKFPETSYEIVYTGPLIGVSNPLFKCARDNCSLNSDYDAIDLSVVNDDYLQRAKYIPTCAIDEYNRRSPRTPWGEPIYRSYRFAARKMLSIGGERTLIGAIIPPYSGHIHGIESITFKNADDLVLFSGYASSIVFDFLIKVLGKTNLHSDNINPLPFVNSKYDKQIKIRCMLLNALNHYYDDLWSELFDFKYLNEKWGKQDRRLSKDCFEKLNKNWNRHCSLRTAYERREALIEIDILTAMALNIDLNQLISIYEVQFPILQSYEADTWYDQNGRIVFTNNRSLTGVGYSRKEWETIKDAKSGSFYQTIIDDTMPGGPVERTIEYIAPFDRCDRIKDYEEVWHNFEERFGKE